MRSSPSNARALLPPAPLAALLAVALILGTAWSLVTPAFQVPDENSHVAYAQSIAEGLGLPGDEGRPTTSTEQRAATAALNADQVAAVLLTKPEWSLAAAERWQAAAARITGAQRSDGGGPNPAGSNPPLSYLADAAAYRVAGGDLFTRLWAMRLTSVLAFLITVLGTWLLAGEVFARDRGLQLAAAGSVTLVPMLGFLAGAVMPDPIVFATWTLALWLGTRVIRRGAHPVDALALGLVVGAGCVTKSASLVLLPATALALCVGAVRVRRAPQGRTSQAVLGLACGGAGLVATLGAWVVTSRVIGRAAASQVNSAVGSGAVNIRELLSSVWQFYLPRLPFQAPYPRNVEDIPVFEYWVKGTTANFGWLEVHFGDPVYFVIAGVAAIVLVLAIAALWRLRERVDLWLLAFFALLVLTTLAGLHWTDYRQLEGGAAGFVQGRYLLPLAGLGGLTLALALRPLAARRRAVGTAVVLAALYTLNLFSFGLVLERFYA